MSNVPAGPASDTWRDTLRQQSMDETLETLKYAVKMKYATFAHQLVDELLARQESDTGEPEHE